MKRFLSLFVILVMTLTLLSGCGNGSGSSIPGSKTSTDESSEHETQYYYGNIGETMSCVFFDFVVDEVWLSEEYLVAEGDLLLDVTVTITNTFGDDLPMFNGDFFLSYGEGDEDYCFGSLPEGDDNPSNMPESYTLKEGETVTYHMYFEIPEDSTEFYFVYVEYYDNGEFGDYYSVYFEM